MDDQLDPSELRGLPRQDHLAEGNELINALREQRPPHIKRDSAGTKPFSGAELEKLTPEQKLIVDAMSAFVGMVQSGLDAMKASMVQANAPQSQVIHETQPAQRQATKQASAQEATPSAATQPPSAPSGTTGTATAPAGGTGSGAGSGAGGGSSISLGQREPADFPEPTEASFRTKPAVASSPGIESLRQEMGVKLPPQASEPRATVPQDRRAQRREIATEAERMRRAEARGEDYTPVASSQPAGPSAMQPVAPIVPQDVPQKTSVKLPPPTVIPTAPDRMFHAVASSFPSRDFSYPERKLGAGERKEDVGYGTVTPEFSALYTAAQMASEFIEQTTLLLRDLCAQMGQAQNRITEMERLFERGEW